MWVRLPPAPVIPAQVIMERFKEAFMTPQQQTANTIIDIIKGHPDGLSVDELLSEVLRETGMHNVPFYLGSGRNFASFLHDLEHEDLLKITPEQGTIFIRPTTRLVKEPVLNGVSH